MPNRDAQAGEPRAPLELKAQYLLKLAEDSISRMRWTRDWNRRMASFVRVSTLLGSALVTVFLGLDVSTEAAANLKRAAFVIGALVTLLNALEPFFSFRALWVEHDEALSELYTLRNDLAFCIVGSPATEMDAGVLDVFRMRHNDIWARLSKKWIQFRRGTRGAVAGDENRTPE